MEEFFSQRAEKQDHIINAALNVFSHNGYKKASIADIAEEAGVAKGMVMYYFGSKKNLYLYLVELCGKIMAEEMDKRFDRSVTDFFDKIKMMSDIKLAVMKRHSATIAFLTSAYYETHKDVREDMRKYIADSADVRGRWVFDGTDMTPFKPDIDIKLLEKFLIWAGEGMAQNLPLNEGLDKLDGYMADFYTCLDWMKKYFYKTE